jgi:hypothetical protein
MLKDHVWNELLEARILLHLGARAVARVGRVEQAVPVPVHVAAKSLKVAQAMKHGRGHDEHVLRGNERRHWNSFPFLTMS